MDTKDKTILEIIEKYTSDLKGIEAVETAEMIRLSCRWKDESLQKSMKNLEEIISHATDLFNYLLKIKSKGEESDENI